MPTRQKHLTSLLTNATKDHAKGPRGCGIITVILVCLAVQAVFTLPAYGDEIVWWGYDAGGEQIPPSGNEYIAIDACARNALALKSDGSIDGWGRNDYGEGTPPSGNDFIAIAAGYMHSLALKADGSIVCWGRDVDGRTTPPAGNDFTAIAAGPWHSLALKADGSIVCWGSNNYGQSNAPLGNDFIAIAGGNSYSLALKADGSIVGWGSNLDWASPLPPPSGNNFTDIAAGFYHALALKSDGSIVGWGLNDRGQATPPEGNDFIAISTGLSFSLALKSDGSIVCWGSNNHGYATPPTGNDFTAVAGASSYSFALKLVSQNFPPVADVGGPYLAGVGQTMLLDGSGSDDEDGDLLSYLWTQADNLGSFDSAYAENPYYAASEAGITNLTLTVSDGQENDSDTTMLVVYDPSGGFVTGGGWIWSPVGAYLGDPTLEGKANFGFVSKYKQGATAPTGNTEFVFGADDLDFHSSSYQWLVVNQAGTNAQFKGSGTINGQGDYKFMLWAGDDGPDTFRIKIWAEDEETEEETEIYDNGFDGSGYETGQPIDGGSIIVHAGN